MNAHFKIAVTVLCGMLLGLPAAQAEEKFVSTPSLYVEIDTSEDGIVRAHPRDLTVMAGKDYRLELRNFSQDQLHVVMAPEFAGAIHTKSIRKYPQRVEMPGANLGRGIALPPGERVEVYFQPHKEGRYKLFCDERAHTLAGMEVTIDVRR